MRLESNVDFNVKSIEEFSRVMVPESLDETLIINVKENKDDIEVEIKIKEKKLSFSYENLEGKIENQSLAMVKILLIMLYNKNYSWGALMGVRPTKIVRRFLSRGLSYEKIESILKDFYLLKQEKIDLLISVVKKELEILDESHINMYIGIPFCPSKCSYCSFASYEIAGGVGRYYKEFVDTLLEEVKLVGEFLKTYNKKVSSIYIGGGTPSTLTEKDLERLLSKILEEIDMSDVIEFTFEGGREDSLTVEKIEIIKKYSVDRISLNPQTFNTKTLKAVNRNFNRDNFNKIYHKIKELNLILNMDLILGLPGEGTEDILFTFDEIEKYDIENLTVHTLAFKRASTLFKKDKTRISLDEKLIDKRLEELIKRKGLKPYYMYRQKNIVEWGENIGYSKEKFESIFNIEMIEENQNTIALGCGGISKVVVREDDANDYIERAINPKDPALYIKEMKKRCDQKFELFNRYSKG